MRFKGLEDFFSFPLVVIAPSDFDRAAEKEEEEAKEEEEEEEEEGADNDL